jgi:hypothetical protein
MLPLLSLFEAIYEKILNLHMESLLKKYQPTGYVPKPNLIYMDIQTNANGIIYRQTN